MELFSTINFPVSEKLYFKTRALELLIIFLSSKTFVNGPIYNKITTNQIFV